MIARPDRRRSARLCRLLGVGLVLLALGFIPASRSGRIFTSWPALAQGAIDCSQTTGPPASLNTAPGYVTIIFSNQCGQSVPLAVDLAVTSDEQEHGLMNITQLPADQGEMFDFDNLAGGNEVLAAFWMKDTLVPLSVAFIGKDQTVHEIQDMEPLSLTPHMPQRPYLYAVEANLGWYAQHGIIPGSSVDLSAALSQPAQPSSP